MNEPRFPPPRQRRGVRLCMHEPDRLYPWVFSQHQVWVDRSGSVWEIESMPLDYVENVIGFCELRAPRIRALVSLEQLGEVFDLILRSKLAAATARCDEATEDRQLTDLDWLEQTPLLRALRRRHDRSLAR